MLERYYKRTGHYSKRVLADKIYRNWNNLGDCKKQGICLSEPALGRPKKNPKADKNLTYKGAVDRIEVERKFSLENNTMGSDLPGRSWIQPPEFLSTCQS